MLVDWSVLCSTWIYYQQMYNPSLQTVSYLLDATVKSIDETHQAFSTQKRVSSHIGEQTKRIPRWSKWNCLFFVIKIGNIPHQSQQCFRAYLVVQYCAFGCLTGPISHHCREPHHTSNHLSKISGLHFKCSDESQQHPSIQQCLFMSHYWYGGWCQIHPYSWPAIQIVYRINWWKYLWQSVGTSCFSSLHKLFMNM